MIHYLTIHKAGSDVRYVNDDHSGQPEGDDKVRSIDVTAEQHFAVRVEDDDKGRTWLSVREGGAWSEKVPFAEAVRRLLGAA